MRKRSGLPAKKIVGMALTAGMAAAALAVVPGTATAAEGTILGDGARNAIKDSYLVVLKAGTTAQGVDDRKADLSRRYGGKLKHTYRTALKGFSITMTEKQARRLAADPAVAYVEQDTKVFLEAVSSWGLDRVDQASLPLNSTYSAPNTGSGVTAYVIDTGIRTSHSDFGGRASWGTNTIDSNDTDCHGHGTHVAGTVGGASYGLAKAAKLVAVKIFNCDGGSSATAMAAGIDWVTANAVKPAVTNMSFKGSSTAVSTAVSTSVASGIVNVAAAGNDHGYDACNIIPAKVPEAITVGASTRTDAKSSFSNIGTCVDIFAPGSDIVSAGITNDTSSDTMSGTSMAAPHVAGAAALYLSANPTATPAQVQTALKDNATKGKLTGIGTGSPNNLLYTGFIGGGTTPPTPAGCTGTNGNDVAIPDAGAAVTSTITISGCTGNASATSKVEVHVKHTWRGDLTVDLVAPDGSTYRLKNASGNDSADNIDQTYTANLSSEVRNGAWKLKVQDTAAQDTGSIDTWTLTL
ncbi:S8 family peptidase [Streptomyces sp. SYSU K217416]